MRIVPRPWFASTHYRIVRTVRQAHHRHAKRVLFGDPHMPIIGLYPGATIRNVDLIDGEFYPRGDEPALIAGLHFDLERTIRFNRRVSTT